MKTLHYTLILLVIYTLSSCVKPKGEEQETSELDFENGLLVLNEGLFQQNNSSLTWVNLATNETTENIFLLKNNRLLGDTGNDIKRYGNKIYIVVNASSTVEVVDAKTMVSLKQVNMEYNGVAQQPRQIDFYNGNAYITSFDGNINVLDTTSLTITERLEAGENPEGLAIHDNLLYVANSGGLNFPDYDSTVFVYDLTTNEFIKSYHVGANPGSIVTSDNGEVYVVKRGNYDDNPSELIHINPATEIVTNLGISASGIKKQGNILYINTIDQNNQTTNVASYDLTNKSIISPSLINASSINTLNGVHPNEDSTFYVFDAMGYTNTGYLRLFNQAGELTKSINVGLNPKGLIVF